MKTSRKQAAIVKRKLTTTKKPIFKKLILIFLFIIIGFSLLVLILTPIRDWGAKNYLESGDLKLLEGKHLSAEIDYQKAAILTPLNPEINERINLSQRSETDISKLLTFFQEKNYRPALNNFKSITDAKNDPETLVKLSKSFLEREDPEMAIIAAMKAIHTNSNYRDGLLYLAIAYDRAARRGEIRQTSCDYLIRESEKYKELAIESDPAGLVDLIEM
jgi:tetratricopeptide (TPR) repeat protein